LEAEEELGPGADWFDRFHSCTFFSLLRWLGTRRERVDESTGDFGADWKRWTWEKKKKKKDKYKGMS